MGVITKPSNVQRSGIVRLQVACGMAARCGGAHSQRSPRWAVYRRHGLLPRAQHALLLTQTVHKKRRLNTLIARYLHTRREGQFPARGTCRNSVQKSASSWVVAGKFLDQPVNWAPEPTKMLTDAHVGPLVAQGR